MFIFINETTHSRKPHSAKTAFFFR